MPNGMKRAFTGVALVLICYSLLGFLILPGIAQRIANQQLAAYATVPASLQRIEFNPFSLELSLFGLRIGEQDDRQLAFERLFLDLQWDSLWQRTLHLANVELIEPTSRCASPKMARSISASCSRCLNQSRRPARALTSSRCAWIVCNWQAAA